MKKLKSARETFPGTIQKLECHDCGERDNLNLLFRKDAQDDYGTRFYCDGCLDYEHEPDEED